jgi:DNA-binding protein HU-beta
VFLPFFAGLETVPNETQREPTRCSRFSFARPGALRSNDSFSEPPATAGALTLGAGNEVRLTGFGKFWVSRRPARKGRNPQTGEPIEIHARAVPSR